MAVITIGGDADHDPLCGAAKKRLDNSTYSKQNDVFEHSLGVWEAPGAAYYQIYRIYVGVEFSLPTTAVVSDIKLRHNNRGYQADGEAYAVRESLRWTASAEDMWNAIDESTTYAEINVVNSGDQETTLNATAIADFEWAIKNRNPQWFTFGIKMFDTIEANETTELISLIDGQQTSSEYAPPHLVVTYTSRRRVSIT